MDFVYNRKYAGLDAEALKVKGEESRKARDEFISLYVLADRIGAQELKRQMVDNWFGFTGSGSYYIPSNRELISLYGMTMPGSALRRMSVAMHVWNLRHDKESIDGGFETYGRMTQECPELGADLVRELFARTAGKKANPFNGKPEDFYEPCMKKT